jgi:hypothetical protein
VAAPPLDLPCDGPVTYPGGNKTLDKSSKGRSRPTLNMTTRLGNSYKPKRLGNEVSEKKNEGMDLVKCIAAIRRILR